MAKKNIFPAHKKLLSAMAGMTKTAPAMADKVHKGPKEIRIREADGGFIVSDSSGFDGPSKEKVYKSVSALKKCVSEKFGGGEAETKGEEKGEGYKEE